MDFRKEAARLKVFFQAALLGCLALGTGCSSKKGERPVFKVAGRLTYAGKPMSKATISFYSVDPNDRAVPSHATADEDGRYVLQTYRKDDGAPAGDCVVTITWSGPRPKKVDPGESEADALAPDQLKNAYSRAATSKLRATVRPQDNTIDFTLP